MAIARTRSVLALWGQRLHGYMPPYSPSGLVRGQALMRFPVTGSAEACAGGNDGPATLEQLHAYVHSAEWRASTAPADVVWNANDAQPFYSIAVASPEDVRRCTEYLMRTARAALQGRDPPISREVPWPETAAQEVNLTGPIHALPTRAALDTLPWTSSEKDETHMSICETLQALASVVREHRHLLAGAESLQTGVPLTFLIAQLDEAVTYLEWSRETHRAAPTSTADTTCSSGTQHRAQCNCVSDAVGCSTTNTKRSLSGALPIKAEATPIASTAAMRNTNALRVGFENEVASVQRQLRRCRLTGSVVASSERSNCMEATAAASSPATPFEGHTSFAKRMTTNCSTLPLMTVVTSTHNGLASALKAAAVVWAVQHNSSSSDVSALQVLWRPAPETSLVVAWLMVLLRRYAQGKTPERSRLAETKDYEGVSSGLAAASAKDGGAPTKAMAAATADRQTPVFTAQGQDGLRYPASIPLAFHVLITGGDTAAHFLKPWGAGAAAAYQSFNAMPDILHELRHATTDAVDRRWLLDTPVVALLCYGCPVGQVRDLRRLVVSQESKGPESEVGRAAVMELRTEVHTTAVVVADDVLTGDTAAASSTASGTATTGTGRPTLAAVAAPVGKTAASSVRSAEHGVKPAEDSSSALSVPVHSTTAGFTLLRTFNVAPDRVASSVKETPVTLASRHASLAEVANEVFRRAVVEPPFLGGSYSASSTVASATTTTTTTTVATTRTVTKGGGDDPVMPSCTLSLTFPSTVPGWCSLCFVPQRHATLLLRSLVRGHWMEPWYIGHSLDVSVRRGPAASAVHVQQTQDALRCATSTAANTTIDADGRAAADTASVASPTADAVVSTPSGGRARWRHVCGGFPLPLTATVGRGSTYLLPGLLFADLETVMASDERYKLSVSSSAGLWKGREGTESGTTGASHHRSSGATVRPPSPSATLCAEANGHRSPDVDDSRLRDAVMRAVCAVEADVAGLVEHYDTAEVGYRGVVAGNFLFVCRYPDALESAVRAAVVGDRRSLNLQKLAAQETFFGGKESR